MSTHNGAVTHHTKRRGKIHQCDWCGQPIVVGERYATWLWFMDGERGTVYLHDECHAALNAEVKARPWWDSPVEFDRDNPRPKAVEA